MPGDSSEQQTLATEVALLRQDFSHTSGDIAEMKRDFKEFKAFYFTKEQAANLRSEFLTAHNSLASEVKSWKRFIVSVGVIVVSAVILAYFFQIGLPVK